MELENIAESLRRSVAGAPWHGPSLAALLADVTPEDAAAHPVAGAHSILELVLHLAAWKQEAGSRLRGARPGLPALGDWPAVAGEPGPAWAAARHLLHESHAALLAVVEALPAKRLDEPIGDTHDAALGTGVTVAGMLAGLAQHDAYHGGQIAILERALAVRRAGP